MATGDRRTALGDCSHVYLKFINGAETTRVSFAVILAALYGGFKLVLLCNTCLQRAPLTALRTLFLIEAAKLKPDGSSQLGTPGGIPSGLTTQSSF